MSGLRILVADDHALIRRGLRELLETQSDWEICAEVQTGREAVAKAKELTPDIAVLDISMPDLNGIGAARRIQRTSPETKILMLSMHYSEQLLEDLRNLGVHGYVAKTYSARDLVRAVRTLVNGQLFFSSPETEQRPTPVFPAWSQVLNIGERLTTREREIAQLLSEGKSSKDVASILGITLKTTDTHRSNLMRKLQLHNIADLVRYAVRNRIIEP